MRTYDPRKNRLNICGISIFGYSDGTFIKVSRNEDALSLQVGSDGKGVRTLNANKSGKFEITLQAGSPCNDLLAAQANFDEATGIGVAPSMLRDLNGATQASAQNSWIVKHADLERAKATGDVTWTVETDELDIFVGGIVDVPSAIAT